MSNYTADLINSHLPEYLESMGINLRKHFRCLNPTHYDRHPSMHYMDRINRVHCFSCDTTYDLIDLIGLEIGTTDRKEAFKAACSRYTGRRFSNFRPIIKTAYEDNTEEFKELLREYWRLKNICSQAEPFSAAYADAIKKIPYLEYRMDMLGVYK